MLFMCICIYIFCCRNKNEKYEDDGQEMYSEGQVKVEMVNPGYTQTVTTTVVEKNETNT